ncbi:MAG TPA: hypothetical protein VMH26_15290 [Burkholderiales bacterium]|nr:hypothetical protein [Burkholderiales bacterium]
MSRSSIIRIVPTPPPCRSSASDLRYRLLMAGLGSEEETNPLLSESGGAAAEALEVDTAPREAKPPAD